MLIWAYGQSRNPFYGDDEFKYHGRGNRGKVVLGGMEHLSKTLIWYIDAV